MEGCKFMKRGRLTRCWLIGFVAVAVCLAGCGSGSGEFANGGPSISVTLRGGAEAGSVPVVGAGSVGLKAEIISTADSTCLFSGGSVSDDGYFEILWGTTSEPKGPGNCGDENNCLYCNVDDAATANCTIACDGLVASNSLIAADSFSIYVTAYHLLGTDMPTPDGMIRVDGNATSLDSNSLLKADVDVTRTFTPCEYKVTDGGNDLITVSPNEGAEIDGVPLDTEENGIWHVGHEIDQVNGGSTGYCHLEDELAINADMTGADTPDASIDLSFGAITMTVTICDSQSVCDEHTP